MENRPFFITQGNILLLLVYNDRRSVPEIAKDMGVHPKTIPGYYGKTQLPEEVIEKACRVFNVDPSVFNTGEIAAKVSQIEKDNQIRDAKFDTKQARIDALQKQMEAVLEEVRALREENLILRKPNLQ